MTKDAKPYAGGALDALEIVVKRLPATKAEFLNDEILADATLMRLQEAGEHLTRIRDNFPDYYEAHHTDAWHRLIGLRNVIAHGYLQIDLDKVWGTITNNVPELIRGLRDLE